MKFRNVLMLLAASVGRQPRICAGRLGRCKCRRSTVIWPRAFGMAIASGLCGLGQARAVAASAEAMARNPSASAAIRFALILGLVFIESLALYTLVIIFMKVGA